MMEQILLAYGFSKETVTAIMMLYNNTKAKVCSQIETQTPLTLGPHMSIICLDFVLRMSLDLKKKENGFILKKA